MTDSSQTSYEDYDDIVADEDMTALREACIKGDIEQVHELAGGADINSVNYRGVSPLVEACGEGHIDIVRLLIEKGAKIKKKCIEYASCRGHLEIVKLLHEVKPILVKKSHALYSASALGHTEVVRFLIEKGGVPENYALKEASNHGYLEIVKLLIAAGAAYNKGIRFASRHGHANVVQLLVDAGGNPGAIEKELDFKPSFDDDEWGKKYPELPSSPFLYRRRSGSSATKLDNEEDEWPADRFIEASGDGNLGVVQSLLCVDDSSDKVYGLRAASLRGNTDIVKILLQHGGVPTRDCLEVACLGGFTEIVKLLLEVGVQYNHAMNSASSRGHTDIVQVLLDAGANENAIREKRTYEPIIWDDSDEDEVDDGWQKN